MASISISGWGVGRSYTLSVTESSYNSVANTSVVSWTLSASGDSGTWYDYYLKAVVNGTTVYNKSGGWSDGSFPAATGSTSGSMTISHGSDGKKTISFSIEGYAYSYSTKSNSGTLTLTNIDRSAPSISISSPSSITINSMNVTATSNVQCDQFAVRYAVNGGSYGGWTYWTGNASSHTFSLTGLSNNTSYTIQVAGRKKSNAVWGYSSSTTAKTLGASTITTASDITLGNNCSVTWTPLNNTFKFKLSFSLGTWSYTTDYIEPASTSAYTYNSYTIPVSVANELPNSPTGTMTAVLTTYASDNTQVGASSSKTFTVTVPAAIVPTITSVTLEEGTLSGYSVFVKSLSTVKATVVSAGAYSSTIASVVVKVGNNSYTANSSGVATSDVLQTYGSITVLTTVTDTRGRTATDTKTITVYDYFRPTVSIDINIDTSTNTVTTTATGSIAPVNNLNAKSLTIVRRRLSDDTTTTYTVNPLSAYDYTVTWTQTVADIGTESYEYTATVTDTKQSVSVVQQTAIICISRLGGGRGVTFFEEASKEGFWIHDIEHDVTQTEYLNMARRLAFTYSATETWEQGEFCIYSDNVYECLQDITTPEAWTAAHWLLLGTAIDMGQTGHQGMGLLDYLHPVGEIFISIDSSFNPNTAWGGVWTKLENKFLVGAGDLYDLGDTGGEATHTLTQAELPTHNHGSGYMDTYAWGDGVSSGIISKGTNAKNMTMSGGSTIGYIRYTTTTTNVGADSAHNNLPPYEAVYMWQRVS